MMLARMEGKIDAVGRRLDDLVPRVERHDISVTNLLLRTQGLEDGAVARDKSAIEKAQVLKDAKDAQESTARAVAAGAEKSWTPVARLMGYIAAVAVIWGILSNLHIGVG